MPWDENAAKRLGLILRELREARGLTQEALATRAGITKTQLQLIEAGRASSRKDSVGPSNPRMATISALAGALGLTASDLLRKCEL